MQLSNQQENDPHSVGIPHNFRFLSQSLQLGLMTLLASCAVPNQMPTPGYRFTPAQIRAAQVQSPHGHSSLNQSSVRTYVPGGKITTLAEANMVANALAESYSDCGRKGVGLTKEGLNMARHDFQRVTEFGSTYGQGEDPQDASGRTISWSGNIAPWLGMNEWLNNHINQQAAIARRDLESRGQHHKNVQPTKHPKQTQITNNTGSNNALAQHYAGLYGSLAEASKPMPWYANVQPKTFIQHRVQQGETFSGICKKYNKDRRVAWNWNSATLPNPHEIKPGMVIYIPVY